MHTRGHPDVTESQVVYVLENWQFRGILTEDDGRQSVVYLAVVPWRNKFVRVAVSVDDELIITAFADKRATNNWNLGNIDYFADSYDNLEARDAG